MAASPRRSFPRRIAEAGLLVGSVLLTSALLEAGLRLSGYRAPEILTEDVRGQYRLAPNASFVYRGYLEGMFSDFATPIRMNNLGFHDVDHETARAAPDTFRLMVIGDSYVAALSVGRDQTFHRLLEGRLQRANPFHRTSYEVLAFGHSGYGTDDELRYLRKFGPLFRPDAVLLLFFCGNDVMENSPETYEAAAKFAEAYKARIAPRKIAFFNRLYVLPSSRLNGWLAETATTIYAERLHWFWDDVSPADLVSPELGVYRTPLSPSWRRAYERTDRLLTAFRDETRRLGAPLLIAGLTGPQAMGEVGRRRLRSGGDQNMDLARPERWLAEWTRAHDVPYLSLEPTLIAAGQRNVFWRHDGHLNVYGNGVIAGPIADFVARYAGPPAP